MAEGRSKRERGVTQDNCSSEARDRRKVAGSNSLEEGGQNRGTKSTVMVQDKGRIGHVVDARHGREQGQYSSRKCRRKIVLRRKIIGKNTGNFFGEKIGEGSEVPGTGTGVLRYMHAGGGGGATWMDQRVSVLLLDPVRKGVGESRAEKETEVGVKRAVPSVPIRALTDQRLWARWVLGTT